MSGSQKRNRIAITINIRLSFGGKYELMYTPVGDNFQLIGAEESVGSNHLGVVCVLSDFTKTFYVNQKGEENQARINLLYSALIDALVACAVARGYSYNKLISVTHEKLSYNRTRLDHKKEQRLKEGGGAHHDDVRVGGRNIEHQVEIALSVVHPKCRSASCGKEVPAPVSTIVCSTV